MGSSSAHNAMMKDNLHYEIGTLNDANKNSTMKSILRKIKTKTMEEGSIHDCDKVRLQRMLGLD